MAALPEVLAGPIVRRVESNLCSFWIALSHPAAVQVSIWPGIQKAGAEAGTVASGQPEAAGAIGTTLPAGRSLHVAVISIRLAGSETLQPGQVHSYDVQVVTQSVRKGLRQLGLLKNEALADHPELSLDRPLGLALGYVEDQLPTFVTPPPTIERVRMAHCSCRKSTSPGHDALAWLDGVIDPRVAPVEERPQQLFLTGDQIYADDLSGELLVMLGGLAQDLMGANEQLDVANAATPQPVNLGADLVNFPAARRHKLVIELAGYTTEDGESHLLSFGEYAAMYLAVWSPRVWRSLGTAAEVFKALPPTAALQAFLSRPEGVTTDSHGPRGDADAWREHNKQGFARQLAETTGFRDAVPHVARVLANTATYMIFDDHDVTDDWNLSRKWVNRVNSKPFGRHIVRNAIMAYVVFQGWGNDPAAYDSGRNAELLAEIVRTNDGENQAGADPVIPKGPFQRIETLCGLSGATFDQQARFNYVVRSPRHEIVVLDTRTRRKFEGQAYRPPDLIGLDREQQIPKGPLTDGREVLFVVSAAPVLGPEIIDGLGWPLAQVLIDTVHFGKGLDATGTQKSNIGVEKYDAEGWSTNDLAREELLKRMALYDRAAFLGGDVHFACSLAMDYYRKDVARPSRLVQLTASPARNRFKPVVKLLLRQNAFLQQTSAGLTADRLAWANGPAPITLPQDRYVSPGRRARIRSTPSLLPAGGWPAGTARLPGSPPPDWRWRLQLIRDERPDGQLPPALRLEPIIGPTDIAPPAASDPQASLAAYRTVAARHQRLATGRFEFLRQMVFQTNIGLIALGKDAAGKIVLRHALLSQSGPGATTPAEGTVHLIELEPSTKPPPDLTVRDPPPPGHA